MNIKNITLRNTLMTLLGYAIVIITSIVAGGLSLITISVDYLAAAAVYTVASNAVFIMLILIKREISAGFSYSIGIAQLLNWLVIFSLMTIVYNEERSMVLLFAFIALVYLLSIGRLMTSLIILSLVIVCYIASTIYAVYYLDQSGSIKQELFHVSCYLPAGIFISYMAGLFYRQRQAIRKSKNEIEKVKDKLWDEMQLAKKIQSMMIPDKPIIKGFEVTGFMQPAAEIGGDYYDVINDGAASWILIGDVSGHGVPAGMVMMMLQTSVKTTISQNPGINPSKLLISVNNVLTENIRALGEDKFISLSVLCCREGCSFVYAGLHENIMLYRNDKGTVEMIRNEGAQLGIRYNLESWLKDSTFSMNTGDTLLLYTDGITGAVDERGETYSKERLIEAFRLLGNRPTGEIKNGIIEELNAYRVNDDISMLILKRVE